MAIPIDSHYIPAFSIEDVLLDKDTGAPLSGGQVYFWQDNQRGTPMPVYQITGNSPDYTFIQLPNPIILSSIGTFEDSLGNPVIPYFFPYDGDFNVQLYYIQVLSSADVPQFDREAQPYVPSDGNSSVTSAFVNELSNPQFAEILFDSPMTYTFNAASLLAVPIAPDWDIVVSCAGVGSVTVTQITPTGALNRLTNPGTILNIDSAGLSSLRLRQRIYGSPNLWGSGYLAASFVGKTYEGTSSVVTMYYSQSNGSVVDEALVAGTLTADGLYAAYPGNALIPASTSSQTYPDAYIDIELDIPLSQQIDITSVMLAFTGDVPVDNIDYDQESLNRQIDHLFHYYKPGLDFKPISSYLVGWDFPLNPSQANGFSVAAPAVANAYTWDQTILFQSTVSNIATSRDTDGSIVLTSSDVTNSTQAALIQYLPRPLVTAMLKNPLSVNIRGLTNNTGGLSGVVSLWYTTNSAVPVLPLSVVTTLDATGYPSAVTAGWIEIARSDQAGNAVFNLGATIDDYGFSGWDVSGGSVPATATYFAVVVGTEAILDTMTVTFNSISMVPGTVPTRPAPTSDQECLSQCEYYYEKSYGSGTAVGTATYQNSIIAQQLLITPSINTEVHAGVFGINYRTHKRAPVPNIALYSAVTGTVGSVNVQMYNGGTPVGSGIDSVFTNWATLSAGSKGFQWIPNTTAAIYAPASGTFASPVGFINYHYVVDARLGIV